MFSGTVFGAEFISELAAVLAWLWDDRICSKHVAYFVVFFCVLSLIYIAL